MALNMSKEGIRCSIFSIGSFDGSKLRKEFCSTPPEILERLEIRLVLLIVNCNIWFGCSALIISPVCSLEVMEHSIITSRCMIDLQPDW